MRKLVLVCAALVMMSVIPGSCASSGASPSARPSPPSHAPSPTPLAVVHARLLKKYVHALRRVMNGEPALYHRMVAADKANAGGKTSRDAALAAMTPFVAAYQRLHAEAAAIRARSFLRTSHRHLLKYLDLMARALALKVEGIRYATSYSDSRIVTSHQLYEEAGRAYDEWVGLLRVAASEADMDPWGLVRVHPGY